MVNTVQLPVASVPSGQLNVESWRVQTPHIDYGKCIRCMICWKFCPDNAISISPPDTYASPGPRSAVLEAPTIMYNHCKGCGICAQECPEKCIEMSMKGGADE